MTGTEESREKNLMKIKKSQHQNAFMQTSQQKKKKNCVYIEYFW